MTMKGILRAVAVMAALAAGFGTTPAWADIYGQLYIGSNHSSITHAGSFDGSTWNGTKLDYLYCMDVRSYITPGDPYGHTKLTTNGEVDDSRDGSFLSDAGEIAFLLDHHGVGGHDTPQAVALQLAIWKLIYNTPGFEFWYPNSGVADEAIRNTATAWYGESVGQTGNVGNYLWFSPGKTADSTIYQAQVGRVPEPASMVLFGAFVAAGLLGVGAMRKLV